MRAEAALKRARALGPLRAACAAMRERYAGRARLHRPLRVTARLVRPVAVQDPILLDGLLRVGFGREHLAAPELAGVADPGLRIPLPLGEDGPESLRWPAASVAHFGGAVVRAGNPALLEYTTVWHKTWEHSGDDYLVFRGAGGKPTRGKISVAGAQYKGWAMRLCVVDARVLRWWCRGDAEEIARLLAGVPAVGKKQSYGHGLVAPGGWTVEEVAEDWSSFGPGGRPTRPIPADAFPGQPPGSAPGYGAWRSPAYDASDWREVWVPD